MDLEPLPETRYQMVSGNKASLGARIRHYGPQVLRKIWRGFEPIWVWRFPLLVLLAVVAICVGAVYKIQRNKAEGLAKEQAAAVQHEKDKAQAIEVNRKRAYEHWTVWTKSFQGNLTRVCSEIVYNDPPYRYEVICHLGVSGQPPTKKLVCSDLLCDVSNL